MEEKKKKKKKKKVKEDSNDKELKRAASSAYQAQSSQQKGGILEKHVKGKKKYTMMKTFAGAAEEPAIGHSKMAKSNAASTLNIADASRVGLSVLSMVKSWIPKEVNKQEPAIASPKQTKKHKDVDSDSSDEGSKRSKKKRKTAGKSEDRGEESKMEEESATVDYVAIFMFILNGIILVVAVILFIVKPLCQPQGNEVSSNEIDGKPTDITYQETYESTAIPTVGSPNTSAEVKPVVNTSVATVLPNRPSSTAKLNSVLLVPEDSFQNKDFPCGLQQFGKVYVDDVDHPTDVIGIEEWPWMVRLRKTDVKAANTLIPVCAGTIITPRHVISACHCVGENASITDYRVSIFDDRENGRELYEVAKLRKHPSCVEFKMSYYTYRVNDLLLITVKKEIQFSKEIQPLCLPPAGKTLRKFEPGCFGFQWEVGKSSPRIMQKYYMRTVTAKDCERKAMGAINRDENAYKLPEFDYLAKELVICAFQLGSNNFCVVESGGPINCAADGQWTLHGVGSWGFNCELGSREGVYSTISFSLPWICCFMKDIPGCRGILCDVAKYGQH